jgi:hypothetical protein
MLVLLGPPFSGSEDEYSRLAAATGMLAYDLKTRIRPAAWGVVRALGNDQAATALCSVLRGQGFRVVVVDPVVASDPDRPFVALRAIELGESEVILHLSERKMPIGYRALLTLVRGEVQLGSRARRQPSSAGFRAVVPTAADVEVFRETVSASELDAYAAADLHFQTVLWAARIDVRNFDFSILGAGASGSAQDLDRVVDYLAERAGLRVDRASRISSVASYTGGGQGRSTSPIPGQVPTSRRELPERFDAYSRLVAEAERQAAKLTRTSTRPPPMP